VTEVPASYRTVAAVVDPARKFSRESQPTKGRYKGVFKLGYYLDNKLRRFGFIGMCKFLDQGEGQDGESQHKKREVSVTNAKYMQ
jgi:hypothetical protein